MLYLLVMSFALLYFSLLTIPKIIANIMQNNVNYLFNYSNATIFFAALKVFTWCKNKQTTGTKTK